MQNSEYHNTVFLNAVGNDLRNINQDFFTGYGHSSGSAHARLIHEFGYGATNAVNSSDGG